MFRREHDLNLYWEFPGNLLRQQTIPWKCTWIKKLDLKLKFWYYGKLRNFVNIAFSFSFLFLIHELHNLQSFRCLKKIHFWFCKALMKSCILLIFHNAIKQCFKSSKRTMSQFMMHFHFCKADFIDKAALLFWSIITSQKTHLRNWVELEKFWWMIHAEYIFINKYSANLLSSSLPYVNFQPMMISWERNVIMPKSKNNSLRSQIFNWARNSLNLNQQINKLNRLVVVLILLWRDYLFKTRGTHTSRRLPPV